VRYIPIIFFIFLFSFTVISCAKKSDSSSSSSASSSSASSSSEIVSVSDSGGYIQIESTNHSLDEGDVIRFTTTDTLPKGLALATDYYVVGTPSTSTFFVSATESGTPIVYTDGGTGTHSWQIAIALGSTGNYQLATHDFANGVVTDSSGNVYVTGGTKGGLDGNTSAGNTDLFVLKYNSSGTKQWTKQLGSSGRDSANAIAIDSSGNLYVAGITYGGLDWNTNSGANDLFVVKYNSSGTKQWTEQLGTPSSDAANAVATDSSGNVYVAGVTYGVLGDQNKGNSDLFVVKYNSSGTKQWVEKQNGTVQNGTDMWDEARGVVTDSSGNVYVVGGTKGVKFYGDNKRGMTEAFVIKYNSSGKRQWTKLLGTWRKDFANAVAIDSSGNIYVAGATERDLEDEPRKDFAGKDDLFVVKYDSKGKKKWTKQLGTKRNDRATGVATDSSGNIYVTGYTYWGLDGNTYAGSSDAFVVKYLDNGTKQWTKQFGTSSTDLADGVATDSSGNVYVVGYTYGGLDGNTNTGASDIFVVKYNSSGTKQWTKQLGSSGRDYDYGVATDSSRNVYVSGDTYGGLDNNTNAGSNDLFGVKYNSRGTKQ
jgi:uncharacterized delta-60 repeat protein